MSSINWYPGHMHKARKEMLQVLPSIDVIIEVLDARLPASSANPVIAELRGQKPCLKLLNKADLADPKLTKAWQTSLESEANVATLPFIAKDPQAVKSIPEKIRQLVPERAASGMRIRVLVVGIPNVGKSTLINSLLGRPAAKVGNEPAVTKRQQQLHLDDQIILNDTPGILWPKVENPSSAYRLAVSGAIRDTAFEYEDIALFAAEFLAKYYPEKLKTRYQLPSLPDINDPFGDVTLLELIGKKRGAVASGGRVNLHKAAEALIQDVRSQSLGCLTLETPEMVTLETIEVEKALAEKAEAKKLRLEEAALKRSGKRH